MRVLRRRLLFRMRELSRRMVLAAFSLRLLAGVGLTTALGLAPAFAQLVGSEIEPNDSPATATPLSLASGCALLEGAISPTNDVDYFSFVAPPGAKVWIFVDTGGPPNP